MDVDVVAGIHKFIGHATYTTQAAFRSNSYSKVFALFFLEVIKLIFATCTLSSSFTKLRYFAGDTRNVSRVSFTISTVLEL